MGLEDRDYMKDRKHDSDWKSKTSKWNHEWETGEFPGSYDEWYDEATRPPDNEIETPTRDVKMEALEKAIRGLKEDESHARKRSIVFEDVVEILLVNGFSVEGYRANKGGFIYRHF